MNWEYKIVYFGLDVVPPKTIGEDEYEERLHDNVGMLNEMGKEGWELISFLTHTTSSGLLKYHAVFKRPKA